jgi:hypothetical protein
MPLPPLFFRLDCRLHLLLRHLPSIRVSMKGMALRAMLAALGKHVNCDLQHVISSPDQYRSEKKDSPKGES